MGLPGGLICTSLCSNWQGFEIWLNDKKQSYERISDSEENDVEETNNCRINNENENLEEIDDFGDPEE